jgi:hypothetical protein
VSGRLLRSFESLDVASSSLSLRFRSEFHRVAKLLDREADIVETLGYVQAAGDLNRGSNVARSSS